MNILKNSYFAGIFKKKPMLYKVNKTLMNIAEIVLLPFSYELIFP